MSNTTANYSAMTSEGSSGEFSESDQVSDLSVVFELLADACMNRCITRSLAGCLPVLAACAGAACVAQGFSHGVMGSSDE